MQLSKISHDRLKKKKYQESRRAKKLVEKLKKGAIARGNFAVVFRGKFVPMYIMLAETRSYRKYVGGVISAECHPEHVYDTLSEMMNVSGGYSISYCCSEILRLVRKTAIYNRRIEI